MLVVKNISDDTVSLSGKVNMSNLLGVRRELEGRISARKGGPFKICLKELQSFNSAVLSMLLCLIRASQNAQCDLQLQNIPSGLFDMARVGGIEALINNS